MKLWPVNYMASMPLSEQVKNKIQLYIKKRQLKKGDFLVPAKTLSKQLGVSENTSQTAYKLLEEEGFVTYIKRKGYIVSFPSWQVCLLRNLQQKRKDQKY